jgi:hypothetical protein
MIVWKATKIDVTVIPTIYWAKRFKDKDDAISYIKLDAKEDGLKWQEPILNTEDKMIWNLGLVTFSIEKDILN